MSDELFSDLLLSSGVVTKNRIAKAAMEESLAIYGQVPDNKLVILYRTWANGGVGLLITGNIMVDPKALTGPGAPVLTADSALAPYRALALAGQENGAKIIMQINHPGRQVPANQPGVVWGPSAKAVDMGRLSNRFGIPKEMTSADIAQTIEHFIVTAQRAQEAGFNGVEVHAAHGYLISQFLSPLSNLRDDEWGGSLTNRARFLIEVVKGIRDRVDRGFVVAVKLNSADFQRGGFDADDAKNVIDMLAPLGVDFIELSGGSYESPAMMGKSGDARTLAREAYFLDLAKDLVRTSPLPLMLTGGITKKETAERVLESGVSLVGIGTQLSLQPDLANLWAEDQNSAKFLQPLHWKNKHIASAASMGRVRYELSRIAKGKKPCQKVPGWFGLLHDELMDRKSLIRYRKWLANRQD